MNLKLYHLTKAENIPSIMKEGLKPNGMGIVYLSPNPQDTDSENVLLEVETGNNRLTAFDDCKEWEVLCWGHIYPEYIKLLIND